MADKKRISAVPDNYETIFAGATGIMHDVRKGAVEVPVANSAIRAAGVGCRALDADLRARVVEKKFRDSAAVA